MRVALPLFPFRRGEGHIMFGEIYFQKVCEGLGWRASGTSRAKEQANMEME